MPGPALRSYAGGQFTLLHSSLSLSLSISFNPSLLTPVYLMLLLSSVCESSVRNFWGAVRRATSAVPDAGYTRKHYALAVLSILDHPHHAPLLTDLEALLGGREPLLALARADTVFIRPWSDWTEDIPYEAFLAAGGVTPVPVVTASSPLHLYVWKAKRQRLMSILLEEVHGDKGRFWQDNQGGSEEPRGRVNCTWWI
jgi:hypothetical protein